MVAESQKQKIVGLDIGTNKVATIVAEVNEFQELEIIGIGTHASSGLKRSRYQYRIDRRIYKESC